MTATVEFDERSSWKRLEKHYKKGKYICWSNHGRFPGKYSRRSKWNIGLIGSRENKIYQKWTTKRKDTERWFQRKISVGPKKAVKPLIKTTRRIPSKRTSQSEVLSHLTLHKRCKTEMNFQITKDVKVEMIGRTNFVALQKHLETPRQIFQNERCSSNQFFYLLESSSTSTWKRLKNSK